MQYLHNCIFISLGVKQRVRSHASQLLRTTQSVLDTWAINRFIILSLSKKKRDFNLCTPYIVICHIFELEKRTGNRMCIGIELTISKMFMPLFYLFSLLNWYSNIEVFQKKYWQKFDYVTFPIYIRVIIVDLYNLPIHILARLMIL